MNRNIRRLGLIFSLALQVALFQNCSDAKFTQETPLAEASVSPDGIADPTGDAAPLVDNTNQNCSTSMVNTTQTVKILLLVDASGSNVDSTYQGRKVLGTDTAKQWRLNTINDLVNRYGTKNNFFFGLATFHDKNAQPLIKDAKGDAIFSNSQAAVQAGISRFKSTADAGDTPYKSAMTTAKEMISADLAAHPGDNAVYSVVLISDGQPSDYGKDDLSSLTADAKSIVTLAPSKISLNGVFYYRTSKKSQSETQYMLTFAAAGHGVSIIANADEQLVLSDILKIPKETCQ